MIRAVDDIQQWRVSHANRKIDDLHTAPAAIHAARWPPLRSKSKRAALEPLVPRYLVAEAVEVIRALT
jgi:hypothetical protein